MGKGLKLDYDEEADVLDVSLGEPKEAISKEVKDDFFVRLDPENGEVVGFMILNFEKTSTDDMEDIPVEGKLSLQSNNKKSIQT